MTEVIVNDEKLEVEEGETLMDAGRRQGAHMGFWCNGRGICTFCECKVEEGGELLNSVTGAEKARLSSERIANGSRLACRTTVTGENGTVRLISRAEEFKRQFLNILKEPIFSSGNQNLGRLLGSISQASVDYLTMFPYVFKGIATGKTGIGILNPFKDINSWLQDGSRVIVHQIGRDATLNTDRPEETEDQK